MPRGERTILILGSRSVVELGMKRGSYNHGSFKAFYAAYAWASAWAALSGDDLMTGGLLAHGYCHGQS
jgi:hypothetical protein